MDKTHLGKTLLIWGVSRHFGPNRMQLDCFVDLNEMVGGALSLDKSQMCPSMLLANTGECHDP